MYSMLMASGAGAWILLAQATTTAPSSTVWWQSEIAWVAIGALAAVFALRYAASQARAAHETLKMQWWLEAQRLFTNSAFTTARGKVMGQDAPVEAERWKTGEQLKASATIEDAYDVCRGMDQMAWIVKLRGFPSEIEENIWLDTFCKTWIVLKPLVLDERKRYGFPNKGDVSEAAARKWNAFDDIGEDAVRRLGWPKQWLENKELRPRKTLLESLGWWDIRGDLGLGEADIATEPAADAGIGSNA